jgi:hypothetical protein
VEVTSRVTEELSPPQVAMDAMQLKNSELCSVINQYTETNDAFPAPIPPNNIGPFTMCLKGVVDAAVMGGIAKYQQAFFSEEYDLFHPAHSDYIKQLKALIVQQLQIVKSGLELHGRLIAPEQLPLHQHMVDMFSKLVQGLKSLTSASCDSLLLDDLNRDSRNSQLSTSSSSSAEKRCSTDTLDSDNISIPTTPAILGRMIDKFRAGPKRSTSSPTRGQSSRWYPTVVVNAAAEQATATEPKSPTLTRTQRNARPMRSCKTFDDSLPADRRRSTTLNNEAIEHLQQLTEGCESEQVITPSKSLPEISKVVPVTPTPVTPAPADFHPASCDNPGGQSVPSLPPKRQQSRHSSLLSVADDKALPVPIPDRHRQQQQQQQGSVSVWDSATSQPSPTLGTAAGRTKLLRRPASLIHANTVQPATSPQDDQPTRTSGPSGTHPPQPPARTNAPDTQAGLNGQSEPPARPTDPSARPTDLPARLTDLPPRPTDPSARPTDLPPRPIEPPSRPAKPPSRPTGSPTRPSNRPELSSQPSSHTDVPSQRDPPAKPNGPPDPPARPNGPLNLPAQPSGLPDPPARPNVLDMMARPVLKRLTVVSPTDTALNPPVMPSRGKLVIPDVFATAAAPDTSARTTSTTSSRTSSQHSPTKH